MSYIEKNLMNGENILYRGKLHWVVPREMHRQKIRERLGQCGALLRRLLRHHSFLPSQAAHPPQ